MCLLHEQVGWLSFDPCWDAKSLLLENILISEVRKTVLEGLRGLFLFGWDMGLYKCKGLVL